MPTVSPMATRSGIRAVYLFLEEVLLQPPVTVKAPIAPVQVGPAAQGLQVPAVAQPKGVPPSPRSIHAVYLFLKEVLLQPPVTVTASTAPVQVGSAV